MSGSVEEERKEEGHDYGRDGKRTGGSYISPCFAASASCPGCDLESRHGSESGALCSWRLVPNFEVLR